MTKIYTLVNQKGGVGKTTTAINLGAYLARLGQKVLIVDLDAQANATSCLGIDKHSVAGGTYEALLGMSTAGSHILTNPDLKISILPSAPSLAGAEVELVSQPEREFRLRAALQPLIGHYDYILIDCPPSLSLLTVNGLMAAQDGVIIPVQCEYLALEGLGQLTQTLQRIRASLYPEMKIRGLVMTMFEGRTSLAKDVVSEVRKHFPGQVFGAIVPRSIRLAEAPSYGLPIAAYAPSSTGAQAYHALAEEILQADRQAVPAG
ncbi:MAG: ParA family protein [Anaerolineales bacterium]